MSDKFSRIANISNEMRESILRKSVRDLPNSPSAAGMSAFDLKRYFYQLVTDGNYSALAELQRVIDEVNSTFGQIEASDDDFAKKLDEAIQSISKKAEATALEKEISDRSAADSELQEKIESAQGTIVEGNPTEAGTEELNKIKIGDKIYTIPSGGGGGTGGGGSAELEIGTVTTKTLDAGMEAEVDIDIDNNVLSAKFGIPRGADGQGMPSGGTAGQVLTKVDGSNYNAEWKDIPESGVKKNEIIERVESVPTAVSDSADFVGVEKQLYRKARYFESNPIMSDKTFDMPEIYAPTNAVRIGNIAYVFIENKMYKFNLDTKTFDSEYFTLENVNEPASVGAYNGYIYAIGNYTGFHYIVKIDPSTGSETKLSFYADRFVIDEENGFMYLIRLWSTNPLSVKCKVASLNTETYGEEHGFPAINPTTLNSTFIYKDGYIYAYYRSTSYKYDCNTFTSESIPSSSPFSLYDCGISGYTAPAEFYGKFVFVGGAYKVDGSSATNKVAIFDFENNKSYSYAILPSKMWNSSCVVYGNICYVFGGKSSTLGTLAVGYEISLGSYIYAYFPVGTDEYADLNGKPKLNTSNTTAQTTSEAEEINGTVNLHKVSKTGSYNDLNDKPTIPESYALPVATSETLGGVKPETKTAEMTQTVGVDADGKLWTTPSEGGGGSTATIYRHSIRCSTDLMGECRIELHTYSPTQFTLSTLIEYLKNYSVGILPASGGQAAVADSLVQMTSITGLGISSNEQGIDVYGWSVALVNAQWQFVQNSDYVIDLIDDTVSIVA